MAFILSLSLSLLLTRLFPLSRASTSSQVLDWGFRLPYGCVVFQEKNRSRRKKEPSCGDPKKAEPFFAHPSLSSTSTKKTKKLFNNSPASGPNRARILAEIREENDWKTDFVLGKRAGAALR